MTLASPVALSRVLLNLTTNALKFTAEGFVEVIPNRKVVFTFGWEEDGHPIPPGSTTIEITLHPEGDKTRVRLVHSGLPDDALDDHGNGWALYLERLAVRVFTVCARSAIEISSVLPMFTTSPIERSVSIKRSNDSTVSRTSQKQRDCVPDP